MRIQHIAKIHLHHIMGHTSNSAKGTPIRDYEDKNFFRNLLPKIQTNLNENNNFHSKYEYRQKKIVNKSKAMFFTDVVEYETQRHGAAKPSVPPILQGLLARSWGFKRAQALPDSFWPVKPVPAPGTRLGFGRFKFSRRAMAQAVAYPTEAHMIGPRVSIRNRKDVEGFFLFVKTLDHGRVAQIPSRTQGCREGQLRLER